MWLKYKCQFYIALTIAGSVQNMKPLPNFSFQGITTLQATSLDYGNESLYRLQAQPLKHINLSSYVVNVK